MRLIDADALKEEIEFHPTSVSVCMTVEEAKGQTYFKNRCLEDIDNAPTIDAIPMWWITEKFLDVLNKDKPDVAAMLIDTGLLDTIPADIAQKLGIEPKEG